MAREKMNAGMVFVEWVLMVLAILFGMMIMMKVVKVHLMGRQYESIKGFCGYVVGNEVSRSVGESKLTVSTS